MNNRVRTLLLSSYELKKPCASLNLDASLDELRYEECADELEAAVAARLLHVEEDEDDGVLVLVALGPRQRGGGLQHRGHAGAVVVVTRGIRHLKCKLRKFIIVYLLQ